MNMSQKNIVQILKELNTLNDKKSIDSSICSKLICKIKNGEFFYYDEEKDKCYKYLKSLVDSKVLSNDTFELIKKVFEENENNHKEESSKIIHSIVSKTKEERRDGAKLKNKKKAFWITFFTGIIGWTYCYYCGNTECKKIANHIFIGQIAFTIAVVSIVTSILMLR